MAAGSHCGYESAFGDFPAVEEVGKVLAGEAGVELFERLHSEAVLFGQGPLGVVVWEGEGESGEFGEADDVVGVAVDVEKLLHFCF